MNERGFWLNALYDFGNTWGQGIGNRDNDKDLRKAYDSINGNMGDLLQEVGPTMQQQNGSNFNNVVMSPQAIAKDLASHASKRNFTDANYNPYLNGGGVDYTKLGATNTGVTTAVPTANQANSNNPYQLKSPVNVANTAPTLDDLQKQQNQAVNFLTGGTQIFNR